MQLGASPRLRRRSSRSERRESSSSRVLWQRKTSPTRRPREEAPEGEESSNRGSESGHSRPSARPLPRDGTGGTRVASVAGAPFSGPRSEERRVGKGYSSGWETYT